MPGVHGVSRALRHTRLPRLTGRWQRDHKFSKVFMGPLRPCSFSGTAQPAKPSVFDKRADGLRELRQPPVFDGAPDQKNCSHDLKVAAAGLLDLQGLEQRLEVALAEAL